MRGNGQPLLETRDLVRDFGGLRAVDQVSYALPKVGVHAVIGPNGAGKTTFVNLISGRTPPTQGAVLFNGRDITRLPPHTRVGLGIAYTFQITSIFTKLTVRENVALAAQWARDGAARTARVLSQTGLTSIADKTAGDQSYGHQRLIELAMGLALSPKLLILDEPTQGLAEGEIAAFQALVQDLSGEIAIMLIEHNMDVVMALADRITVLDQGAILAEGTPPMIRADPAVQAAYLGSDQT